jgi:hypothetical protein
MEGRCERHLFDQAVDLCGVCGGEYCNDCLVYSFGPKKPPFCLPCAVARAGVRSNAANYKPMSSREQRKLKKQRLNVARVAAADVAATPAPVAFPAPAPATEPSFEWFAATTEAGVAAG